MSRLGANGSIAAGQSFFGGSKNENYSSYVIPGVYDLTTEDTNWVLTSSFIIFTMVNEFNLSLILFNSPA